MRLSARLKSWLMSNKDVSATSSDEEFRQAAAMSLADESLSVEKYTELTSKEEDKGVSEFTTAVKELTSTLAEFKDGLKTLEVDDVDSIEDDEDLLDDEKGGASLSGEEIEAKPKVSAPKKKKPPQMGDDDEDTDYEKMACPECGAKMKDGKCEKCGYSKEGKSFTGGEKKMTLSEGSDRSQRKPSAMEKMLVNIHGVSGYDDEELRDKGFDIRVKEAADNYSDTKSTLTYPDQNKAGRPHPFAGRPVVDYSDPSSGSRVLNTPSERDQAVVGAFCKFLARSAQTNSKTLGFNTLPQHDKELMLYAMHNMPWGGATDGGILADIKGRKLTPLEMKALIDDSTSGGLEAAPIVFDDQVIQTPLLNGELYPYVNTIPLDRGRRVEGVATGTVTGSWGGVDDTAISLFNTASYVSAFDTTIFRWEGSIRIGLDFLSDTPIDFGSHVTAQYGERLLEDLDDVIAVGNGTTQPEGVINKTGVASIAFGGTTSIGSYESLRFGVAKAEHKANLMSTAVFCGTETSYQRARAIPVGASDARRLGGNSVSLGGVSGYDEYRWMDRPYKINESLTNAQIFYAILGRFRCYRRRGLTMRTSTDGDTLVRRNEMLMVAMGRFGGQLERGACAAITTTGEA